VQTRQLAGLILKNAFSSRSGLLAEEKQQQWVALEASAKAQIRNMLLSALHSQVAETRNTSALVISKIAAIDLPMNEWGELIDHLVLNMQNSQDACLRQSTLMTLGFICEELTSEALTADQVNKLLTAVVAGSRAEETNLEVCLSCLAYRFSYTHLTHSQ
jgi:importin subunit beta-1